MNIIQKRFIYYLFGCIGTRTLLTLLIKNMSKPNRKIASIFTLIIACGFIYIYTFILWNFIITTREGLSPFKFLFFWTKAKPFVLPVFGLVPNACDAATLFAKVGFLVVLSIKKNPLRTPTNLAWLVEL